MGDPRARAAFILVFLIIFFNIIKTILGDRKLLDIACNTCITCNVEMFLVDMYINDGQINPLKVISKSSRISVL